MLDLGAYLQRIGLDERASVAELHRGHVTSIPFENLDSHRGLAVSLAPETIFTKLITARRGGYCFEHNLLFKAVLEEAAGARVEPLLARVRNGRPAQPAPPLTHLLLRVEHGGTVWHMDVGFGPGTLLEPIPFGAGGPYEQSGWRYRVVEEGAELVLQAEGEDGWRDLYAFRPEPVAAIDIEISNWYTCTHAGSRFVSGLMVTAHAPDGTRTTLSDFGGELALSVQAPGRSERMAVAREDVPALLRERFGLSV